jgi:hypothetical protein
MYRTHERRRDVDPWGSCAANLSGPELVYRLWQPRAGRYTATLSELEADLDLIVLRAWASEFECDPTTPCLASSSTVGIADEQVSFEADSVSDYLLVVHGRAGAASRFVLSVQGDVRWCTTSWPDRHRPPRVCSSATALCIFARATRRREYAVWSGHPSRAATSDMGNPSISCFTKIVRCGSFSEPRIRSSRARSSPNATRSSWRSAAAISGSGLTSRS